MMHILKRVSAVRILSEGASRMTPDRSRSGVFDTLVTAARCVVVRT